MNQKLNHTPRLARAWRTAVTATAALAVIVLPGGRADAASSRAHQVHGSTGATSGVVDRPVSFAVRNLDRTALGPTELQTCPANPATRGAHWTVRGHLVAPASALRSPHRAATLYLHGFGINGETSFRFRRVPGYNYALEQAKRGHVSVVIDRIGYPRSTIPNGFNVCIGAQADIAHQVIQHLRAGNYGGPSFDRVALAGHSAGGLIAEVEAWNFHDIDALAVFAYEDQGFTPFLLSELGKHAARCAARPRYGYALTFDDRDDAQAPADRTRRAWFSRNADPRVVAAVRAAHRPDPCGENGGPYIGANPAQLASVHVPVLLVYGANDALFDPRYARVQASHFGSRDKRVVVLPHTAHLLMLEPTAPLFRRVVANWLSRHGL